MHVCINGCMCVYTTVCNMQGSVHNASTCNASWVWVGRCSKAPKPWRSSASWCRARTPFWRGGNSEIPRMSPRGRFQTLMQRTLERRRALCRCVRRIKCRSMKMRVLETERTTSPQVNITAYIQPRGSRSNGTFQSLCGLKPFLDGSVNKPQPKPKTWFLRKERKKDRKRS